MPIYPTYPPPYWNTTADTAYAHHGQSMTSTPVAVTSTSNAFSPSYLTMIRAQSCSRGNFATHLMKESFTEVERLNSNVRGTHNKQKLSPTRLIKIKDASFDAYPLKLNESDKKAWAECVKAIDACNRTLNRKKNI